MWNCGYCDSVTETEQHFSDRFLLFCQLDVENPWYISCCHYWVIPQCQLLSRPTWQCLHLLQFDLGALSQPITARLTSLTSANHSHDFNTRYQSLFGMGNSLRGSNLFAYITHTAVFSVTIWGSAKFYGVPHPNGGVPHIFVFSVVDDLQNFVKWPASAVGTPASLKFT